MNEGHIEIRRLKPDEWQQQRDMRLRMLSEAPEAFGSTTEVDRTFDAEDWQASAQERSTGVAEAMFVATNNERWIGCLIGSRADDDAATVRVWAMWVEPEWRGRGVGYELLGRLPESSRESGYVKMWLKVAATNEDAKRPYERFGFVDTGERSGMRRDPEIPMITMGLIIAPAQVTTEA